MNTSGNESDSEMIVKQFKAFTTIIIKIFAYPTSRKVNLKVFLKICSRVFEKSTFLMSKNANTQSSFNSRIDFGYVVNQLHLSITDALIALIKFYQLIRVGHAILPLKIQIKEMVLALVSASTQNSKLDVYIDLKTSTLDLISACLENTVFDKSEKKSLCNHILEDLQQFVTILKENILEFQSKMVVVDTANQSNHSKGCLGILSHSRLFDGNCY